MQLEVLLGGRTTSTYLPIFDVHSHNRRYVMQLEVLLGGRTTSTYLPIFDVSFTLQAVCHAVRGFTRW